MRITVIDGHPDKNPARFCHALAEAYVEGAKSGGHEVRRISVAEMDIVPIRSREEWERSEMNADIREAKEAIGWAEHLVFVYPLWLGDIPAYFKAFIEQMTRPGFPLENLGKSMSTGPFKGKSARIIVTMGMPDFMHRYFFFGSSTGFKHNVLQFVGTLPVRETVIGMVEKVDHAARLKEVWELGKKGI